MAWNCFWKNIFLAHFLSQNDPFSKHFVTLEWPKWLAMGSKWAHFTCVGTPNGLEWLLEQPIFDPFFTHFLIAKRPIFNAFVTLEGPKWLAMGSKMGSFHLFGHPKWPGILHGKTLFSPIFCPKTPHFQGILGFLEGQNGPPRAQDAPKTIVLAYHVVHNDF